MVKQALIRRPPVSPFLRTCVSELISGPNWCRIEPSSGLISRPFLLVCEDVCDEHQDGL